MVIRNPQAIYASVAIAIPKASDYYSIVTDYRAVNNTIQPAAITMPILEYKIFSRVGPHGARSICCKANGR